MANPFSTSVYPVADQLWSILDLLAKFIVPPEHAGTVSPFSDLHLKAGRPAYYRHQGELIVMEGGAILTQDLAEQLIRPFLTAKQFDQLQGTPPRDVDTSWYWTEKKINFRLNVFNDIDGLAVVLRVLPNTIPDIAEIGLPSDLVWREICMLQQGLVLVTGATGSGKSTTIAAMLNHINRHRRVRVITLEDPIEYIFQSNHALFSQRELGRHMPSFADGLRSALREDPDIIYVGELRDPETIALAMTASETGHLVFGTLHTRDTRSALTRILDSMPASRATETATQLSLSLSYVLGQKLLAHQDGGRVLAMEVLKNTAGVANLIRQGQVHQINSMLETGKKEGMNSLESHLRSLVQEGKISMDEAIQNANIPGSFR